MLESTSVWDDENRQARELLPDGKFTTSTYRFDGLRVVKRDSTGTRWFVYDGQNYLAEADNAAELQALYTNEPQVYGKLISQHRKES